MKLPDLRKAPLKGNSVLMRVDFNVAFDKGGIKGGKYRIQSSKETIDFVLANGAKLALLSHLGRPRNKDEKFSFRNIYSEIKEILGRDVIFVDDCIGKKVKNALERLGPEQILMLENVRFYKEDVDGDENFARKLTEYFDVYINEAFGVSHRRHASVVGVVEFLPSFAGFNLQKEVNELSKLREGFQRPAVALVGGAKIETKLSVISFFAAKYDWVLVGGKIGLEADSKKIIFPRNVIISKDYRAGGLDIGRLSIKQFSKYLKRAKTIIWNGPLGEFEDPKFSQGTLAVLKEVIANKNAFKVAGGGETLQFLENNDMITEFNFVSTGGGAMLEFLVKGSLPGIEALLKSKVGF